MRSEAGEREQRRSKAGEQRQAPEKIGAGKAETETESRRRSDPGEDTGRDREKIGDIRPGDRDNKPRSAPEHHTNITEIIYMD